MVPGKASGKGAIYTVRRHGRVQRSSTEEAETLALVQGRRGVDEVARRLKPKVSIQIVFREREARNKI